MQVAKFNLNALQARKLKAGKPFQMSNAQLCGNGLNISHSAEVHMLQRDANAVDRAIKNNKGFRFAPAKIQGGSLSLKKILGDKTVQKVASSAVKAITNKLVDKNVISNKQSAVANNILNSAIVGDYQGAKDQAKDAGVKTRNRCAHAGGARDG